MVKSPYFSVLSKESLAQKLDTSAASFLANKFILQTKGDQQTFYSAFAIFWLKRCMYSLYSLNTIHNVVERLNVGDMDLHMIACPHDRTAVLRATKSALQELIKQRSSISDLSFLFELMTHKLDKDFLFREGITLVLKAILVEFLNKSQGSAFSEGKATELIIKTIRAG
jgi:hypothetical protein